MISRYTFSTFCVFYIVVVSIGMFTIIVLIIITIWRVLLLLLLPMFLCEKRGVETSRELHNAAADSWLWKVTFGFGDPRGCGMRYRCKRCLQQFLQKSGRAFDCGQLHRLFKSQPQK